MPESRQHFKYLDSARGIAAFMVLLSHFIGRNFPDTNFLRYSSFIFNGNGAVSFFFVLSGFVLSYKYVHLNDSLDVKKFYVSRILRLFPAYFIALVIFALFRDCHPMTLKNATDIFIFNRNEFWEEALMVRFHNRLNYPGWTLTLEMICSFLIPFFIALAIKDKRLIPYLIVVLLIIGNTINFSYVFLFGIIVSSNFDHITSASFKDTKWYRYRWLLLFVAVIFFSMRQINDLHKFGPTFIYIQDYLHIDYTTYTAPACFVFLVAILRSKHIQRFLETNVLVFLGKISYSIYLVHVLVMDVIYWIADTHTGHPLSGSKFTPASFTVVTLICVTSVILVATLLYYFIERPFINIGRRVTASMRTSLVIKK